MEQVDHPLYVALLWHMHQPFYKDLATGEYWLPWVRLHAVKDYYQMASIVETFPDLRLNFNLVPSLVEQLEDYAKGSATDRALKLSLKPARDLSLPEKVGLLASAFSANWETMVEPHPRYRELLRKRGRIGSEKDWAEVQRYFSMQDLLDLQVWMNLTWFNSTLREMDPFLQHLVSKGRDFSEEEKLRLLERQREVINQILPLYKRLLDEGQIEITTSPYYHPIMPLVCDTDVAKEASPDMILPAHRFRHPEDTQEQIRRGLESFFQHFERRAQGMWPPEGAVSQEVARLAAKAGIQWMASDEEILYRCLSLRSPRGSDKLKLLYQPYCLRGSDFQLYLLFRDHLLSDLIGFTYARWEPKEAAKDFLRHLSRIRASLKDLPDQGPSLVTIILDGENAWEYYKNDGRDFLYSLYEGLTHEKSLQTVRVSDFLERFPPRKEIDVLASGSWIDHNFRIWIGHQEDNAAWDLLSQTRDDLVLLKGLPAGEMVGREGESKDLEKAWNEVYIAEGSDWCWWYGDDHTSGMDEVFDSLFRKHLMNVYHFMGVDPPDRFYTPLIRERERSDDLTFEPADLVHPSIDGKLTNYFEWLPAGLCKLTDVGGTMHRATSLAKVIYAGFDFDRLFLRIDIEESLLPKKGNFEASVLVRFLDPHAAQVEAELDAQAPKLTAKFYEAESPLKNSRKEIQVDGLEAAFKKNIIEIGIPFEALKAQAGQFLQFIVILREDGKEKERWPRSRSFRIKVPSREYQSDFWQA